MAKYSTHNWFNLILVLPICLVIGHFYFPKTILAIFGTTFIIGTFLVNPDCDIAHKTNPYSLRGVLLYPFRFYSRVFKHRGISHKHLIGTCTRIIWLIIFFLPLGVLIFVIYPQGIHLLQTFIAAHHEFMITAFIALVIADSAHIFLDRAQRIKWIP